MNKLSGEVCAIIGYDITMAQIWWNICSEYYLNMHDYVYIYEFVSCYLGFLQLLW